MSNPATDLQSINGRTKETSVSARMCVEIVTQFRLVVGIPEVNVVYDTQTKHD